MSKAVSGNALEDTKVPGHGGAGLAARVDRQSVTGVEPITPAATPSGVQGGDSRELSCAVVSSPKGLRHWRTFV